MESLIKTEVRLDFIPDNTAMSSRDAKEAAIEAAIACLLSNPSLGSIEFLHVDGSSEPLIAVENEQSRVAVTGLVQGVMDVVIGCPHCEQAPCVLVEGELGKYLQELGRSMSVTGTTSNTGDMSVHRMADVLKGVAHQRIYGEEHVMLPECVVNFVNSVAATFHAS
jgi:hypothetical protein